MIKQKPKIIVDTREKHAWCWEGDEAFEEVIYRKLDAGDYSLEGLENIITIERKASVDELYTNFSNKTKKRQIFAEFERARDYKFKLLVVEETCDDVMNPNKYFVNKPQKNGKPINRRSPKMPIAVVTSNLTKLIFEYNVHVIFGGMRAQAMARGLLLHAFELHRKGQL